MTWNTVITKDSVHIMPTHDDHPHIPQRCCECTPVIEYADPKDGMKYAKPMVMHRDELDRLKSPDDEDKPHG